MVKRCTPQHDKKIVINVGPGSPCRSVDSPSRCLRTRGIKRLTPEYPAYTPIKDLHRAWPLPWQAQDPGPGWQQMEIEAQSGEEVEEKSDMQKWLAGELF